MKRRHMILATPFVIMGSVWMEGGVKKFTKNSKPPPLGTREWDQGLRKFLKTLNLFLMDYNEGLLPKARWDEVEQVWGGVTQSIDSKGTCEPGG